MVKEHNATDRATRVAWRPRELAAQSGIPVRTIYGWIAAGLLPAARIGSRTLLILNEDWWSLLQAHRTAHPPSRRSVVTPQTSTAGSGAPLTHSSPLGPTPSAPDGEGKMR